MEPSGNWLARAQLLRQQHRPEQAADELRRHLARDPHEPTAHTLLALCLLDLKQAAEAQQEAELAIYLAPEYDLAFYALALSHYQQDRPAETLAAINQALALDPADADYHHVLASLRLESGNWLAALQAARTGLIFDAEHTGLLALQARALARQGHRQEAARAAQEALSYGSESSSVQAQAGWVALENGSPPQVALDHFREALRLNPTSEFARAGLVEALKNRYLVYRLFMRFMYWLSSLGAGARRGILLGAWLVARFVRPLLPLYLAFAYLSWFSDVLFETMLRFNRYGRYALSDAQRRHSNHFVALLGVGLVALAAGYLLPGLGGLIILGFVALGLLFPLVGTEKLARRPQQQRYSFWAGVALLVVGLLAAGLSLVGAEAGLSGTLFGTFLFGVLGYTLVFSLR